MLVDHTHNKETVETRLNAIEAELAIKQLVARYALAVDVRDVNSLVGLFTENVDCGRWGVGRDALAQFYSSDAVLRSFGRSYHQIGGHIIDLELPDVASGTVYCRAEHEMSDGWVVVGLCYSDA